MPPLRAAQLDYPSVLLALPEAAVIRIVEDASHSTAALAIEGSAWEVVFQTDEQYYTVAVFLDRELALELAENGNSLLWEDANSFDVREYKLITALHERWTAQDFIDELDGWDVEGCFKPVLDADELEAEDAP